MLFTTRQRLLTLALAGCFGTLLTAHHPATMAQAAAPLVDIQLPAQPLASALASLSGQTGIQILSGFLLTLPFQSRFTQLRPPLTGFFLAAMILGTLAAALIVAPAMAHRILFRQHAKDVLVAMGNVLAILGLLCISVTVSLSLVVVIGFVSGVAAGLVAGIVCLVVVLGVWVVLPLVLLRVRRRE